MNKQEEFLLRHLVKEIEGADPNKIMTLIKKNEVIQMRTSAVEKQEIKQAAKACGLSITEYLLRCHDLVYERIRHIIKEENKSQS